MPPIPMPTYEELRRKVQELEEEALRRDQADEGLRKREERYRMIFNDSPLGIVLFDSNGIIADCNECFLEIVGAPREELIGFNAAESLTDQGMRSAVLAGLSGKPNCFEGDYRSVTGDKLTPVRAVFSRTTSGNGRFLGAVGLFEDITERKKSEEALRESQGFLGKIVNSISDPIFVKDRQHRLVLVNDAACALAGRKREDMLGRTDHDFFPEAQADIFWGKEELVFETGETNENEEVITVGNGATRTIVTKRTLYADNAGNEFIVGVVRDITERKEAELSLRAAHRQLQNIIEFLPDATFVIDRDKKVIYANRAMEEMSGIRNRDIIGKSHHEYAVPFYGERGPVLVDILMDENFEAEKRYDNVQKRGMTLYGESFSPGVCGGKGAYLWFTATPLLSKGGNAIGYIESVRDISDRKKAEEALRQSEEKYRQLFETVSDAIILFDADTRRLIDVNEKACSLYGFSREEFLQLTNNNITAEPDKSNANIEESLAGTRTRTPLRYHIKKDRTVFPVEVSSSTFFLAGRMVLCGVIRDITERRLAEEELRRYRDHLEYLVGKRTADLELSNDRLTHEIKRRKQIEEELRQSKAYLSAAIENTPFEFWSMGQDGRYTMQNRNSRMLFGDIVGKRAEDVWLDESMLAIWQGYNRRAFSGEVVKDEVRYFFRDEERYCLNVVSPIQDAGEIPGIVGMSVDITERKLLQAALEKINEELETQVEERTKELSAKNDRLEEFNAALKILLQQREDDKKELEESILSTVKSLIVPYVEKLKRSRLGADQMTYLAILESHLREITSPFAKALSAKYLGLSPLEIQAAGLIMEGKTTQEIAESMCVSENTVSAHRFHIRKKLGLTNKKVNLRTYLNSLKKE